MFDRGAARQWYRHALEFKRSPREAQMTVSAQQRCSMLRIADLPPEIGNKLDEMKAPLDVCRRVAFGDGIAEQLARAVEALAKLAERDGSAHSPPVLAGIGETTEQHSGAAVPAVPVQASQADERGAPLERSAPRDLQLLTRLLAGPRGRNTSRG